jgi:ATP synthase protein I
MSDDDKPDDELHDAVNRERERQDRWRREGERSLGRNLAMIGSLGWLIITPMLIGIFVGRWIDAMAGSGITFTAALLFVGLLIGARLAWQHMNRA